MRSTVLHQRMNQTDGSSLILIFGAMFVTKDTIAESIEFGGVPATSCSRMSWTICRDHAFPRLPRLIFLNTKSGLDRPSKACWSRSWSRTEFISIWIMVLNNSRCSNLNPASLSLALVLSVLSSADSAFTAVENIA